MVRSRTYLLLTVPALASFFPLGNKARPQQLTVSPPALCSAPVLRAQLLPAPLAPPLPRRPLLSRPLLLRPLLPRPLLLRPLLPRQPLPGPLPQLPPPAPRCLSRALFVTRTPPAPISASTRTGARSFAARARAAPREPLSPFAQPRGVPRITKLVRGSKVLRR
jgi:hypothetical protein